MTDRRAGKVLHVLSLGGSNQSRARNANDRWRSKRSDAGQPRNKGFTIGLLAQLK